MHELERLKKYQKGLIIHHWDTDGLCSAALLVNYLIKINPKFKLDLKTPIINNYFLEDIDYHNIKENKYDFIITCDINFPEDVINSLNNICPNQIYIFDHHRQKPYKNVFYFNKNYPSCSLVINEYLKQKYNLTAVLGAIGDQEEKIKKDEIFWPQIKEILAKNNISLTEALHMRNLIDSCYQTNDYYSFREVIELLQHDPLIILEDVNLRNNLIKVNQSIVDIASQKPLEINEKILFFPINSPYNILSQCTRLISRANLDNFIVTWQKNKKQTNIYIRRGDLVKDLSPIIDWARKKGFNAGGKPEVAGIIFNGDFQNIKKDLTEEIKKI